MSKGAVRVLLGVSGGIAAYKACEVLRGFQKAGAEVQVVLTEHAAQFVAPATFSALSKKPVITDLFEKPEEITHIKLAQEADLFVVVPATANILAKMAHGIADDMLSTMLLATTARVVVAPAMNSVMYQNPATQQNLIILRNRGIMVIEPEEGHLACDAIGKGKLAVPAQIVETSLAILNPEVQDLAGLRVVVTAGPTREPLDPVRYITNRSSGKMGYSLAKRAAARGADVTLLSGPVSLDVPKGVKKISFTTTEDLLSVLKTAAADCDILIQAAAPADYRAEEISETKIKKKHGENLVLTMIENPDVAATVGAVKRPEQVFVGFAAETDHVTEHAVTKLDKKNLDMIVANDVTRPGAGFDVDTNIVTLISREEIRESSLMPKSEVADLILDASLRIWNRKNKEAPSL